MLKFFSGWHQTKNKNNTLPKNDDSILNMDFVSTDDQYFESTKTDENRNSRSLAKDVIYIKIDANDNNNTSTTEISLNSEIDESIDNETINTSCMVQALANFKQNGLKSLSQYEANKEKMELHNKLIQEDLKDLEALIKQDNIKNKDETNHSGHITANIQNNNVVLVNDYSFLTRTEPLNNANNVMLKKPEETVLLKAKFDMEDLVEDLQRTKKIVKKRMKYGINSRNRNST